MRPIGIPSPAGSLRVSLPEAKGPGVGVPCDGAKVKRRRRSGCGRQPFPDPAPPNRAQQPLPRLGMQAGDSQGPGGPGQLVNG